MRIGVAITALLLATVLPAQAHAGDFVIGDEHFVPADILDARAIPDLEGPPVVMITFTDAGTEKLAHATREGNSGRTVIIPITLDGQSVTDIVTTEVRSDPVLTFTARGKTIEQATALAKEISGKDPLPEDLAE